jgi:integrase
MKSRKGLRIFGFRLESRKDKQTREIKKLNIPILVDFKFDIERVIYPIGYKIDEDKWNHEDQIVKRNNFNSDGISFSVINKRIERIKEKLPEIYIELVNSGSVITRKVIWNKLKDFLSQEENLQTGSGEELPKEQVIILSDIFQKFIDFESRAKNWSVSTIKKMSTLKKHLTIYNPQLRLDDISEDFMQNYIDYQLNTLKLNNTTNFKYIRLFKWFMNWATKKGYNRNLSFKTFEYKFKGITTGDYQKNIIFLSWDEFLNLFHFDFENNTRLSNIRDIHCFSCVTGLRHSDLKNLKKNDIKTEPDGSNYMEITTIKTDDPLRIELNKFALTIWERNKDIVLKDNKAFNVPSTQKYNKYLQEAGEKVGFKSLETYIEYRGNQRIETTSEKYKFLTSKSGRKSFIINALYLDIPERVVRSWTGHKTSKSMDPYVKIVDLAKKAQMNKFDKLDFKNRESIKIIVQ